MLKKESFNKLLDNIRAFTVSDWYSVMLFAGACIVICTGQEVIGTYIIACFIAFTLAISSDFTPALEGIIIICCFAIRCKYSADAFLKHWYLAIPVFIFLFLHFKFHRPGFKKTSFMPGMIATSTAILLGGAGIIYWKSYFSPTSIFYMFSLGFGMVILCGYISASLGEEKKYDFADKFSKIFINVIAVLFVSLLYEYISRRAELAEGLRVIPFQWRNNASTLLMLAMPFAFYLARKNFAWSAAAVLAYFEIVFTGSRGGLIFGTIELFLCLAVMFIIDKKHRFHIFALVSVFGVALIIASKLFMDVINYTVQRMFDPKENSIRFELFKRGIEDFKANPLFGRGLAYMGNRDIHKSAKHTLCWYHCSFIQVLASCGLTGAAAFIYLNVLRIKTFIKNLSYFSIILFLSFIGLEMMSLVNPGIFAPFPYLMYATVYFTIMEKCNHGDINTVKQMMGKSK